MPKHMTLDDRIIISNGLNSGLSFSQIGKQLGKATSTISREVRNRRKASDKGAYGRIRNRCIHRTSCTLYDVCPTCAKKGSSTMQTLQSLQSILFGIQGRTM